MAGVALIKVVGALATTINEGHNALSLHSVQIFRELVEVGGRLLISETAEHGLSYCCDHPRG